MHFPFKTQPCVPRSGFLYKLPIFILGKVGVAITTNPSRMKLASFSSTANCPETHFLVRKRVFVRRVLVTSRGCGHRACRIHNSNRRASSCSNAQFIQIAKKNQDNGLFYFVCSSQKAMTQNPEGVVAIFSLGYVMGYSGNIDEGLTYIDKAIAMAPDSISYKYSRGELKGYKSIRNILLKVPYFVTWQYVSKYQSAQKDQCIYVFKIWK